MQFMPRQQARHGSTLLHRLISRLDVGSFCLDDAAVYDFGHEGVLRDNLRLALRDDPLIQQFFNAAAELNRIRNAIPGMGEVTVDALTSAK